MAGRIPDSDIVRVRELSPVADVISEHVTLKSAGGGSLKGLCPFHDERSPSFNVTPARGFWHCFGCGEGGDVISFVQKIDQLSFTEAVERLAARVNYELHYEQGGSAPRPQSGQRARLVEAHRLAAEFYAEQLTSAEAVIGRQFLDERGFDAAAAAHFGVGYAPNGWEHLVKHLRGRGFTDDEMATGGLASRGQRGVIDRFRGRLVWPIRDVTGDVVGFGARKLREDDDGPKYLNTPESPLYKKSQVLYGIDLAKREMAKARQAVVVEGYTDVMACHLAGVTTAVATCGTAFGDEHVRVLRRLLLDSAEYAGEVIFTFDGDAAGQKAARARVRERPEVRHAHLRRDQPRQHGPLRAPHRQGRRRGARSRRPPPAAVRVRDPQRAGRLRPRDPRGPGRGSRPHDAADRLDQRHLAARRICPKTGRLGRRAR